MSGWRPPDGGRHPRIVYRIAREAATVAPMSEARAMMEG